MRQPKYYPGTKIEGSLMWDEDNKKWMFVANDTDVEIPSIEAVNALNETLTTTNETLSSLSSKLVTRSWTIGLFDATDVDFNLPEDDNQVTYSLSIGGALPECSQLLSAFVHTDEEFTGGLDPQKIDVGISFTPVGSEIATSLNLTALNTCNANDSIHFAPETKAIILDFIPNVNWLELETGKVRFEMTYIKMTEL